MSEVPAQAAASSGRPEDPFVYLASQSPRRRQLLEQIGVAHQVLLPGDPDEAAALEALEAVLPGEPPARYVRRVTALKLDAAQERLRLRDWPDAPILCADTTVALGRAILGKPADAAQARAMLGALAGRSHRVLTAVAGQWAGRRAMRLSVSTVVFAPLDAAGIDAYVATGEPFGKAGGYGIQGRAARFVRHISGSYTGIMGLPLFETAALLDELFAPAARGASDSGGSKG